MQRLIAWSQRLHGGIRFGVLLLRIQRVAVAAIGVQHQRAVQTRKCASGGNGQPDRVARGIQVFHIGERSRGRACVCGTGDYITGNGEIGIFLGPVGVCLRREVVVNDKRGCTAGIRIDGGIDRAIEHDLEAFVILDNAVLNNIHRHQKADLARGDGYRMREIVIAFGKVGRKRIGRARRCRDADDGIGHRDIHIKNLVEEDDKADDLGALGSAFKDVGACHFKLSIVVGVSRRGAGRGRHTRINPYLHRNCGRRLHRRQRRLKFRECDAANTGGIARCHFTTGVGLIDIHRRAAAAVGRAACAGGPARGRGFGYFGGVGTRCNLRLQCGDVSRCGGGRCGGALLAHVEHIIIERNFGIAAEVKHAAVF